MLLPLYFRFTVATLLVALLAGCSNARLTRDISVSQGLELLVDNFADVKEGMSSEEVRELIGPPQIRWQPAKEIWIYHYKSKDGATRKSAEIHFDDDKAVQIVELGESPEDG